MARECIQGRDGAEFLSPFRCFLLQEPFNLPFLISAPGPVFSVWSGRQYQHRHLQRPLSWNGSKCYIFIVWYLISFDWMLPFCQFSSCVAIYNLQFIAASICASTFWFSWCSGQSYWLKCEQAHHDRVFLKEDIFMGSIIYGLLATTLIWESTIGDPCPNLFRSLHLLNPLLQFFKFLSYIFGGLGFACFGRGADPLGLFRRIASGIPGSLSASLPVIRGDITSSVERRGWLRLPSFQWADGPIRHKYPLPI